MGDQEPVGGLSFKPRNLIVLSDGTGNSSAKLFKTNVWRIYEALDLNCPDQIALYDDGVGTAAFKPLAVLGGAFGFGLKRNVLDLYMFLCRNYRVDPDQPEVQDRIFAFGFSRGAFTIRVLTALVATQGLIQHAHGTELRRLAHWAYRAYRADKYRDSFGVRALRKLRDAVLSTIQTLRGKPRYDQSLNRMVDIEFVGVFDTVAAYGLPLDELTRGWDRWIWPMLPRARQLSPRVKRACHALALDDERQTFFPLLWDERGEEINERSTHIDQERITQMWFAGVHSNVGGGYPDDSLAFQPLCWMAREAERRGLRFQKSLRPSGGPLPDNWLERASPCAPMNDSRRGLGGYYRYHPRPVTRFCNDPDGLVGIARPKVHESVFERILDGRDGYAPITLPSEFVVVTSSGEILAGDKSAGAPAPNPYEESSQAASRVHLQQQAWNAVWWRRVVYFATVGLTLLVLLLPFTSPFDGFTAEADAYAPLKAAVDLVGSVVPGFAQGWLDHYREKPAQLFIGVGLIALLMWIGSRLKDTITRRMGAVWERHGLKARSVTIAPEPSDSIYRLRTSPAYTGFFRFLSGTFWPTVFGAAMLFLIAVAVPLRLVYEVTTRSGNLCPVEEGSGQWEFPFEPGRLCHATGIPIERGTSYRVQIALPEQCEATTGGRRRTGRWMDASIPVDSSAGFPTSAHPSFAVAVPLRRVINQDWFVPMATIGTALPERHALSSPETTFTARRRGNLTLFVNDAMVPCPGWDCLYGNNSGGPARVRVTKLDASGQPKVEPLAPYSCEEQQRFTAR